MKMNEIKNINFFSLNKITQTKFNTTLRYV